MEPENNIKECIKSYVQLDDEIKILNSKLKELKQHREIFAEKITDYLMNEVKSDNPSIAVGNSILKIKKFRPKKRVNKEVVQEVMEKTLNDKETVMLIVDELYNKEDIEIEEVCKLKRTKKN